MRKVEGLVVNDINTATEVNVIGLTFFETKASEIKDAGYMGSNDKEVIDNYLDFIADPEIADWTVAFDRVRGKDLMGYNFSGSNHIDGLIIDGTKYFL